MVLARRLFFRKSRSEASFLDPNMPLSDHQVTPVSGAPADRAGLTADAMACAEDHRVNTGDVLRGVLTSVRKRGFYSLFDISNLSPRLVGDIG